MGMTSGGSKELRADINVTPLIDVLLVLLIIFMVIKPTAVRGLDTLLPQPPKSRDHVDQPQAIVVQVLGDRDHGVTYKINETSMNKLDIEPKLSEILQLEPTRRCSSKVTPIWTSLWSPTSSITDIWPV